MFPLVFSSPLGLVRVAVMRKGTGYGASAKYMMGARRCTEHLDYSDIPAAPGEGQHATSAPQVAKRARTGGRDGEATGTAARPPSDPPPRTSPAAQQDNVVIGTAVPVS